MQRRTGRQVHRVLCATGVSVTLAAAGLTSGAGSAAGSVAGGLLPNTPANHRVTLDAPGLAGYARYDGGTDATTAACSTGRRNQNEPAIAVDPLHPNVMASGANEYCQAALASTDPESGFPSGYYRSVDSGTTWADSLVPGYAGDATPAALQSPTHGKCYPSGDPTMSFDGAGRLFYGWICFNGGRPINGGLFVSTYDQDGAHYARTATVRTGTPSRFETGSGLFQDKPSLVADQSTNRLYSGNVYIAWDEVPAFGRNDVMLVARSTDHGATFSKPVVVNPTVNGFSGDPDLAVGPDGTLYLSYRSFSSGFANPVPKDAIYFQKSSDGGRTFSRPVTLASVVPYDSYNFDGAGLTMSMCGDGPFACASGLHYARFQTNSAVTADNTGVHVVWAARLPSGQVRVFVRNSPDGTDWSQPATQLDYSTVGHQWWPDIASADGVISVAFMDSRNDSDYSPDRPPGNKADGHSSGPSVDAYVAQSLDGGKTWTETRVSGVSSNDALETGCYQRCSFVGDYIYISAVPGAVAMVWTDMRDVVTGTDPRPNAANDGFDTYAPCTYVPNDINAADYTAPLIADPCFSQGGKDVNIYSASW